MLMGHSLEKICEIIPFNHRLGPNQGMLTNFEFFKSSVKELGTICNVCQLSM
jgi:hypothetical protein